MATTLYRGTWYSLTHLIEEIRHGKIALPNLQRSFVWTDKQVRDLFDSLYRGFPVGTLLFWETGADTSSRQIGLSDKRHGAKLLIIDGQQRLTSLYTVLTGEPVLNTSFEQRNIRIAFRPRDEKFEVTNRVIEGDPEFIPDIARLWDDGYRVTIRKFFGRLTNGRRIDLSMDEEDLLEDRIYKLHDIQNFNFQAIELNSGTDEEQAADIFVRINYQGAVLNRVDFILTLMSVYWDKGRKQLEAFCRDSVVDGGRIESTSSQLIDPSPDQLLRVAVGLAFRRGRLKAVYDILRGKNLKTGDLSRGQREIQFDKLRRAQDEVVDPHNWHEFLKCIVKSGFRSKRMITSQNALMFSYMFWLIGRKNFQLDLPTLRRTIGRWFFMAHTTSRYSGSAESQLESDLSLVGLIESGDGHTFTSEMNRIVRSSFDRNYWKISLPNLLDNSSRKSPALCAYWASLNLLNARVLFSDTHVQDVFGTTVFGQTQLQRGRLFSKEYLNGIGVRKSSQQDATGNMVFVEWPQESGIDTDDPAEYWPAITARFDPDRFVEETYWHALPKGWEHLDYFSLLSERRKLMAKVIRDGYDLLWEEENTSKVPSTLEDYLAVGESQNVEYKATATVNLKSKQRDKAMEHSVVKTVCGFLNTTGGMLLIGIDDSGIVVGLEKDMRALGRANADRYELFLRDILDSRLSMPTVGIVDIGFDEVDGDVVCMVSVAASGRAVFATPYRGGRDPIEFWVRVGNATKQLHGDDMLKYMSDRWN